MTCIVPEGVAAASSTLDSGQRAAVGAPYTRGASTLHAIPFVAQDAYDRLLWACDLNFVRGEDSFVRAQWAARPFVWHIYPQAEDAHLRKLDAFLDRYAAALDADVGGGGTARCSARLERRWRRRRHRRCLGGVRGGRLRARGTAAPGRRSWPPCRSSPPGWSRPPPIGYN